MLAIVIGHRQTKVFEHFDPVLLGPCNECARRQVFVPLFGRRAFALTDRQWFELQHFLPSILDEFKSRFAVIRSKP